MIVASTVLPATTVFSPASAATKPTTTQPAVTASSIMITMGDHSVTLSQTSVPHGVVSFTLTNPSSVPHEIDIVRTVLAATKLPTKPSGQFNEHTPQAKVVREAVKIKAGATRTFTAQLTSGHYVLVDNLPGHYKAGEAVELTITEPPLIAHATPSILPGSIQRENTA